MRPIRDAVIVRRVYMLIRAALLGCQLINVVCTSGDFMNSGLNLSDKVFFLMCRDTLLTFPRAIANLPVSYNYVWVFKHIALFLYRGMIVFGLLYTIYGLVTVRKVSLPLTQQSLLAQCWTM